MSNKHPVSSEQAETLIETLYDKSSQELPGDELDQLILRQARDAVNESAEAEPGNVGKGSSINAKRVLKWQRFGSIAATFVMVFTIGLLYQRNQSELRPESPILIQEPAAQRQLQKSSPLESAEDVMLEVQPAQALEDAQVPQEMPAQTANFYEEEASGVTAEVYESVREERMSAPEPKRKPSPAAMEVLMDAVEAADETIVEPATKQIRELRAPEASRLTEGAALEKKQVVKKSARKKESVEPAQLGNTQPRSLAPAAAPMLLQESVFDYSPAASFETAEDWIIVIEDALANNDQEKAQSLWNEYRELYPEHQPPEALLRIFVNDL